MLLTEATDTGVLRATHYRYASIQQLGVSRGPVSACRAWGRAAVILDCHAVCRHNIGFCAAKSYYA